VRRQVSAGGVAYRRARDRLEVAIIRPRGTERWQLPKGIVDPGESPEVTARREVREEAGVEGDVVAPIEEVQYWYVGTDRDGVRVRFHKSVHFFLIAFRSGDVGDHDHEVAEARWVPLEEAVETLAFRNEKAVVEKAREMIRRDATRDE
jgi:8-oxo-dGTP pyrophosphatase MutT (NUDIX family)